MSIAQLKHPAYETLRKEWDKWRLTIDGGQPYIEKYLEKYSKAEDIEAFRYRKKLSYNPARAAGALTVIKNAIFQRLIDVKREGGSEKYQNAVKKNIDHKGNSMMTFLGDEVIMDLLGMGSCFVCVDMPMLPQISSLRDAATVSPYLYSYGVESVINWAPDNSDEFGQFDSLLVKLSTTKPDDEYGLPKTNETYYRLYQRTAEGTLVRDFNSEGTVVNAILLEIPFIPVFKVSLKHSLLKDIANHQIAMLQMASSDVLSLVKGNFSLYVEQYDPRYQSNTLGPAHVYSDGSSPGSEPRSTEQYVTDILNESEYVNPKDGRHEIGVGSGQGRGYPLGTERPAFISPNTEPAIASMKKQGEMAKEIEALVDLALSSLGAAYAAAESKRLDQGGLEAGLSYIGLQLEVLEQNIAVAYEAFLGTTSPAEINYPRTYSLKSDKDRREEAKDFRELQGATPSNLYQKEISKAIAHILFSDKVSPEVLAKINKEIEAAKGLTSDPETIKNDVEMGVLGIETASELRGYDKSEAEKAKKDHADRAARIAIAQSRAAQGAARGVNDMSADPGDSSAEKEGSKDATLEADSTTSKTKQRGKGKGATQ